MRPARRSTASDSDVEEGQQQQQQQQRLIDGKKMPHMALPSRLRAWAMRHQRLIFAFVCLSLIGILMGGFDEDVIGEANVTKTVAQPRQEPSVDVVSTPEEPVATKDTAPPKDTIATDHSPHLIDCHEVATKNETATEFQMARTRTPVPFDMSTYPREQDIWVSKSIQTSGCWECGIVRHVVEALQAHKDSFLLDLGGNIGMMSLSAAAVGSDVYTFEPFEKNYGHMCRSVELNGFHEHLNLFNLALSRHETIVGFHGHIQSRNQGGISVQESNAQTAELKEGVDFARCVTLDSLTDVLPQNRPVVVKLDVEGAEVDVLVGGINYLRQADVVYAAMELRFDKLLKFANDTDAVFQMFESKGLKPMHVHPGGSRIPLKGEWRKWQANHNLGKGENYFDMAWVQSKSK